MNPRELAFGTGNLLLIPRITHWRVPRGLESIAKAVTYINTRPGISSGQSSDSKMGVSCGNVYAYYDGHYNAQPWTLTSSGPGAEHFCTVSSVSQQLQMSA